MIKFTLKVFVFFLAINLWNIGFFKPVAPEFGSEVTIAEANHKGKGSNKGGGKGKKDKCKKNPKKCKPPTVSEFPIQYMVLSGAALILLSGSTVFYIRKRRMQNSTEE